ncbi:MAG: UrcA family protein [Hydrogenophilaceae bacterium]|jgi:UrcA family protein|nr:UrcA family protein [Hydrogenophilaceae bacterium]
MKALITSACLALAALCCLAAPAAADPARENRVVVRYGDLDLDDPADAYRMYARLGRAANEACGGRPDGYAPLETRRRRLAYEACVEGALNRAVARLREPMVTAYHRDHPLIIASR